MNNLTKSIFSASCFNLVSQLLSLKQSLPAKNKQTKKNHFHVSVEQNTHEQKL